MTKTTEVERSQQAAGRTRLAGLSAGSTAFLGAWMVGLAIARLTGAAAVLLVLALGAVGLGASAISSALALRPVRSARFSVSGQVLDVGVDADGELVVDRLPGSGDFAIRVLHGTTEVATTRRRDCSGSAAALTFTMPTAGLVDALTVVITATGRPGLLWVSRTLEVTIDPVAVAPRPHGPAVDVAAVSSVGPGERAAVRGPADGDVDGVRPWRDGEGDNAVHWPSTLRTGSLVVHDRSTASDEQWTIELADDQLQPDDAGRVLFTMFDGLRGGRTVSLVTPSTRHRVPDVDTARRLAAQLIGPAAVSKPMQPAWYRRSLRLRARAEQPLQIDPTSRIATAAVSLVAIAMLLGALGSNPAMLVVVGAGLIAGVLVSLRFGDGGDVDKPWWLRIGVAVATVASLAYVASTVGGVTGLLAALRGPMPDLLLLLLVVHGLEVVDQRTQRVHQAIATVVVAYAAGLRVDGRVGWWIAAWAVTLAVAVRASTMAANPEVSRRGRRPSLVSNRRLGAGVGFVAAGGLAVLAILSLVPVPDGPARLGLPALSNDAPSPSTPGALAGPTGEPPTPSTERRGSLGEVGGYPGFSNTLDTSVRGDLGDDLVMRVRAAQPAFWRGQTFTEFNGRTWSVAPEQGTRRAGPEIDVPATLGDLPTRRSDIPVEPFIQTYYVETDLPNVVFAASRPDVVTFDGSIWTRPDGSMRSNVTLTEGSVYTVVSERIQVTPDLLQQQGDIATTFAAVTDAGRRALLEPYLALPDSTTARTIDLATNLRQPGDSTYQTILRYQQWLGENTGYDLNAPVPAVGSDAVDDFLFESQRGFCEQIASSLAIMLRSQGVPTRIATGYIPGERNRVSGVFEVRASDAHAWVEVWFPDTGWEAFDPTAQVPLSGDAARGTVGGDLISAAISSVASRPVEIGSVVGLGLIALGAVRMTARVLGRRRRGRWGVLQDRFSEAAETAGTNPARARSFDDTEHAALAREVAEILDRVAFDPEWVDDDETYRRARDRVNSLL